MSEQGWLTVATVFFGAVVTIVTLVVNARSERRKAEAAIKASAAATGVKVESIAEKTSAAVTEVQAAVVGLEKIREMVDGQRTTMMAELKAQAAKINDLEKVILAQRETAAAQKQAVKSETPS